MIKYAGKLSRQIFHIERESGTMKKKVLAAVLVAAVSMSMAGCGSKQAESTDNGSKTESEAGIQLLSEMRFAALRSEQ